MTALAFSVGEFANLFSPPLSVSTVKWLISSGKLPRRKAGRRTFLLREDFDRLLAVGTAGR